MTLDLRHVESFVNVAETLSFSTAAARSHRVQSAISTHIRQLETQLGRQLVARGRGQPVALTEDGTAFLVQARRLLALADEVARTPGPSADRTPLRLGTSITFALSCLPDALTRFAARPAAPPFTIRTARSHDLLALLDQGEIDAALLFDQGPNPQRRWTYMIDLAWVAGPGFAPPPAAPLPLAFLEDARDLRRHAFAALDATGGVDSSLSTHPDPVGLRALIAAGQAITVLPRIAVVPPLRPVDAALGLPPLGQVPVAFYAAPNAEPALLDALDQDLTSMLTANPGITPSRASRAG